MTRSAVITLIGREREDGTVYVHSPDLPLFHIVAPTREGARDYACDVLKEYLERNSGGEVRLIAAESAEAILGDEVPLPQLIPAHVIAEVTR